MENTFYPITGLKAAYIAENVVDLVSGYSAGTPEYFAPSENAEWTEEQPSTQVFYDNKMQDMFFGTAQSSIVLRISGISAEKDASIRGKQYISASGRVAGTANPEPPLCALGLLINKGHNDFVYLWFPKGRFSGGNIVATTKTNDVTINTIEYTFTALETDKQYSINGENTGITWFKGDTTDNAFSATGWFSEVQTPDTTSAPSALSLISVPADNATSVAVDANVVVTFNNKISTCNVVLVKSDFTTIANAQSYDAAGKVLTINPSSNLSSASSYAVVLSNIKDIYGQTLADQVINFTTA